MAASDTSTTPRNTRTGGIALDRADVMHPDGAFKWSGGDAGGGGAAAPAMAVLRPTARSNHCPPGAPPRRGASAAPTRSAPGAARTGLRRRAYPGRAGPRPAAPGTARLSPGLAGVQSAPVAGRSGVPLRGPPCESARPARPFPGPAPFGKKPRCIATRKHGFQIGGGGRSTTSSNSRPVHAERLLGPPRPVQPISAVSWNETGSCCSRY